QRTYKHEQEDAGPPIDRETGQIEGPFEAAEAGLHQVNAEKHQADAQQRQATTAPAGFLAPGEEDTEGQHRHRQLRHVELEAGQGNQPGPGGGTQVGAERQTHTTQGVDQAGTEKGNPQQVTRVLDCTAAVLTMPTSRLFHRPLVLHLSQRSSAPPEKARKPSSSRPIPMTKRPTPAARVANSVLQIINPSNNSSRAGNQVRLIDLSITAPTAYRRA